MLFCVDGLLLITAALTSLAAVNQGGENPNPLLVVIGLTALAMGIRKCYGAQTRRAGSHHNRLNTHTLTGLAADSSLAGGSNPRWLRRIASVLAMFIGAIAGVLLLKRSVLVALCICGIASIVCALAVVGWFPHFRERNSRIRSAAQSESK